MIFNDPKVLGVLSQLFASDSPNNVVTALQKAMQGSQAPQAGAGRGFVNPPMANAPQPQRQAPNQPPLSPLQAASVNQGQPVVEAQADAADMQGPPLSAMQQASQPSANGPGALAQAMGASGGDRSFLGRLGDALVVSGSQDPSKALSMVRDDRLRQQAMADKKAQDKKPKITPIAGGAFSMVTMPDGTYQMMKNSEVAQYLDEQETQKLAQALQKIGFSAQAQAAAAGGKAADKATADAVPEMAQAVQNINELRSIASEFGTVGPDGKFVKKSDGLTGPMVGLATGIPLVNALPGVDKATEMRNRAEKVVQGGLRAVLGGQFTQAEGDRFLARAYNPSLDEETNYRNLMRAANDLQALNDNKQAALEYFQKNKTLDGFKLPGTSPSAAPATPQASPGASLTVPGLSPRASKYFQ